MIDLDFKYEKLINYVKTQAPFEPELAIILGSGLGNFANSIDVKISIPTGEIPNYPISTVKGHKGFLHFANISGKKVLLFQGRIHFYEGYSIDQCILPAFITVKLGIKKLLATNAAGGANLNFSPGDLMLVSDFYYRNISKELSQIITTPSIEELNFIENIPSKKFNELIRSASLQENVFLKEGSYFFNKGPTYETPAEVKMQRIFGADAIGMSTVHEVLFAGFNGIDVASISLITNHAAGISAEKLSHQEVIETANLAKEKFERLTKRIIENL